MNILISKELLQIFELIRSEAKSAIEWAEIESDDQFQTENFVGGFDATENEFCFSCFYQDKELWFQLGLKEIHEILDGGLFLIRTRTPD